MIRIEHGCVILTIDEYERLKKQASCSLTPIEAEAAAYVFRLAKMRDMKTEYIRPFRSALGKLEARNGDI